MNQKIWTLFFDEFSHRLAITDVQEVVFIPAELSK
jgi:hypothetical protein